MPDIKFPKISKGILAYCAANFALGCAEYYELEYLKFISVVMSIYTSLLLIITLFVYSRNFMRGKTN